MSLTPEDLQQGGSRDIKVFAGISIPIRGPVLTHKGDTKIIGGIPEDCVMVVEEGNCYVDGKIMGKIAATGKCEVYDTISGVVIARRGDVRAKSILTDISYMDAPVSIKGRFSS